MSAEQPNDPAWGPSPLLRVRNAMRAWNELDHVRRQYWQWLFENWGGKGPDGEGADRGNDRPGADDQGRAAQPGG